MAELPVAPPVDEQGRLSAELQCMECGYILRGLAPTGQCPECGCSIAESLRTGPLHLASGPWLSRVSSGMGWFILFFIFAFICRFVSMSSLAPSFGVSHLIALLPTPFLLWAIWRITSADPDRNQDQQPRRLAWAARGLPAVGMAMGLVMVWLYFRVWNTSNPISIDIARYIRNTSSIDCMRTMIDGLAFAAWMAYMSYLASRAARRNLTKQWKWISWAIIVIGVIVAGAVACKGLGSYAIVAAGSAGPQGAWQLSLIKVGRLDDLRYLGVRPDVLAAKPPSTRFGYRSVCRVDPRASESVGNHFTNVNPGK